MCRSEQQLHSVARRPHARPCNDLRDTDWGGGRLNVQTNPQEYAPLHSSAFAGHIDAIRLLLAIGADRTLMNYRNEPPADTARRTGQTEAVQVLQI
jgi:ankyrin repeat protein